MDQEANNQKNLAMASEPDQLHFLLVPFLSLGHFIPLADIAVLLAQQGVIVTIVTTPLNANRIKPIIDSANESGIRIRIEQFHIPVLEHGLPKGCESMELVPSRAMVRNFFAALDKLQKPLEKLIEHLQPFPACIIADKNLAWIKEVASKFRIPRLLFDGTSCFTLICFHNILKSKVYESVHDDSESFVVPNLPHRIELTRSQLPGYLNPASQDFADLHQRVRAAEEGAYGVVVNSFEELEFDYFREYHKVRDGKVWCVGPVLLSYNKAPSDIVAERGNKAIVDQELCLKWLSSKPPKSVIYVCLGSLGRVSVPQLRELALGLEACNCPFIWVVRDDNTGEADKWLQEEGFKLRTKERGFIINGWAPQVLILSHPSVGAFLTHCGWNSCLEAITAGVPMITWPMFADQFYNDKLIVQVLEVGEGVGCKAAVPMGNQEKYGVLVTRDSIAEAIDKIMGEGKEKEERRERARKLADLAKKSMEAGGSSNLNIKLLIEDITKLWATNHGN